MKTSKILIRILPDKKEIKLSLSLSDEELIKLDKFILYTEKLSNTRFIKNKMGSKLNIKFDKTNEMKFKSNLPNDDDFAAFIHRLRPFILDREDTYFFKTCNLIRKILDNNILDSLLKLLNEYFTGSYSQRFFKLKTNEIIINSEKTLKKWLNAFEFHHDREKINFFKNIDAVFSEEASRAILIMLLIDKSKAIQILSGIIKPIIGKKKKTNFILPNKNKISILNA